MPNVRFLIKGVVKHGRAIPRIVCTVAGWQYIVLDLLGVRRKPYTLRIRPNVLLELRPRTADWWIFLEIFVFDIYARAAEDVRCASTIVDIGANVGFFAVLAAKSNTSVRITALEPFPSNADQARINARRNASDRIDIIEKAVASSVGIATLYFDIGSESGCSLVQNRGSSMKIATTTLDEVLSRIKPDCDVLKMDCEGAELSILRATSLENLRRIGSIIMEYHVDEEVPELLALLRSVGLEPEVLPSISTIYATRG